MNPVPTVHIVDDNESVRSSLERLLRASKYKVRAYACAADFLQSARLEEPGCLIVDLQMPGMNGLELQKKLGELAHSVPVVFLSGQGDIPSSVQAMRQGAEDFLTKLAPRAELLRAVDRALERNARERQQRQQILALRELLDKLSQREKQVLALVVQGRMNKQIAAELGIHERTVKLHRTAVTTKLKAPSVAELTHLVREAGYRSGVELLEKAGTSE